MPTYAVTRQPMEAEKARRVLESIGWRVAAASNDPLEARTPYTDGVNFVWVSDVTGKGGKDYALVEVYGGNDAGEVFDALDVVEDADPSGLYAEIVFPDDEGHCA